jgi:hypothetical protein
MNDEDERRCREIRMRADRKDRTVAEEDGATGERARKGNPQMSHDPTFAPRSFWHQSRPFLELAARRQPF